MNQRLRTRLMAALCTLGAAPALASAAHADASTVFALTAGDRLVSFRAGTPGTLTANKPILGLLAGETLQGIDFRPSTGELYALSNQSRLYRIDTFSGVALQVGSTSFSPALSGAEFGFDFNPVPDRIRVVSDAEQNLRLHPDTGAVAGVDLPLAYAAGDAGFGSDPALGAVAYTNSFAGTSTTSLYGIDTSRDALVLQGSLGGAPISPNSGQLTTVGALGLDVGSVSGFDVGPLGGAVAVLTPVGQSSSRLYNINLTSGAATLVGSIGTNLRVKDVAVAPLSVPLAYGLSAGGKLVSFAPGRPASLLSSVAISGLAAGESLLGIDFRPATGELYGLGSSSRLYRIQTATGAATQVGSSAFSPALSGMEFGFDFNPIPDRIRVVSDAEQNLRLNPNTGAVAGVDAGLAYAAADANFGKDPSIVASAYTANFSGSTSTTLYGIDASLDVLVTQGSLGGSPISPNGGQLFTVGALGLDTTEQVGFDVSLLGGIFASLTPSGASESRLYVVNPNTGAASLVGTIAAGETMRDIAIAPPSAPRLIALNSSGELVTFAPGTPDQILSQKPVVGLPAGETLVGLDYRPATGVLYAQGASNQLYRLIESSGQARKVGTPNFGLIGTSFGFDFNPVPDRIRLVSNATQNLRLNPNTGLLAAMDQALAFAFGDVNAAANPTVIGSAYTSSTFGVSSTSLYGIDAGLDVLVLQGSLGGGPVSPNSGQLFTVGGLGVDADTLGGFDVHPVGGAFAALRAPGAATSQLYSINLSTGLATLLGAVGGGSAISALAVVPPGQ